MELSSQLQLETYFRIFHPIQRVLENVRKASHFLLELFELDEKCESIFLIVLCPGNLPDDTEVLLEQVYAGDAKRI
jgi:hypothetical protein